jgi:hypothetical protein
MQFLTYLQFNSFFILEDDSLRKEENTKIYNHLIEFQFDCKCLRKMNIAYLCHTTTFNW